jgi:hypothetical protein
MNRKSYQAQHVLQPLYTDVSNEMAFDSPDRVDRKHAGGDSAERAKFERFSFYACNVGFGRCTKSDELGSAHFAN